MNEERTKAITIQFEKDEWLLFLLRVPDYQTPEAYIKSVVIKDMFK